MFKTSIGFYTAELYATPAPNVTLFTSDDNDKTMVVFFCVLDTSQVSVQPVTTAQLYSSMCVSHCLSHQLLAHTHTPDSLFDSFVTYSALHLSAYRIIA